ncbi:MAG: glycosyltransferase [Verrucomicrobia bacterium]|nr:glycosyltransferase [Verrucomicrobiota bacterium]
MSILVVAEPDPGSQERCVESLLAQTYPSNRIEIVILSDGENAASSADSACIRHHRAAPTDDPESVVLKAIHGTRSELIVFIGASCVADPTWLSELVGTMQEYNPAIAGGRVLAATEVNQPPHNFPRELLSHFSSLVDYGSGISWGVPPRLLLSPRNLAFWRESFDAIESKLTERHDPAECLDDAVRRIAFRIQCTAPGVPCCGTATVYCATSALPPDVASDPVRACIKAGRMNAWSKTPENDPVVLLREILANRYRTARARGRGQTALAARSACFAGYARGQLACIHSAGPTAQAYIQPALAGLRRRLNGALDWKAWWPGIVLRVLNVLCASPLRRPAQNTPVCRVLTVTPTYFGPGSIIGGGERAASDLAKAIGRQVETTLLSFGSEKTVTQADGIRSCTLKTSFLIDGRILNPWTLSVIPEIRRADVVHCHQPRTMIVNLCILLGRLFGKKVFVTDHGAHERNLFYDLDLQRHVTRFLVVAEYTAHAFGFPLEKTTAIYNGIEPSILTPAPEKKKRKVLFVGRITPGKGIHYLVEAVDPETETVIIGKPDPEEYYQELLKLSEGKNVKFILGTDSYEELREHYQSAAVTVLSSFNNDLFPMVILESFACGTPAICSNAGGTPELVKHGVNGFLTPIRSPRAVRERINYLLDHPDVAISMGAAGRELIVNKLTWDAVALQCIDAYSRHDAPA